MNFNRKIEKYQSKLKNSLLKNDLKNSKIYSDKLKYYNNLILLGGEIPFFENKIYDRIRAKANDLALEIFEKPLLSSSYFYKKENYDLLKERSGDLLKIFDESIVPEDDFQGCKDTHKNKDNEDPKWDYYFWVAKENCDKTLAQIIYLDILEKKSETETISLEKGDVCPFENNHRINIINKFELSKKDKNPDRDNDWNNNKYSLYKLKNCIHGYVLRQLICAIYVNNALSRIINSKFDTNSLDFRRVLDEANINEKDGLEKAKAYGDAVKTYFSNIDYAGAFNELKDNIEVLNEIRIVNDRFANNKDFVYKKDNKDCGVFGGILGAKCINDDSLYNTN
jgi:hypothetical protein